VIQIDMDDYFVFSDMGLKLFGKAKKQENFGVG